MMQAVLACLVGASALALAATMPFDVRAQDQAAGKGKRSFKNQLYIVELAEPPVVGYLGNIRGLPATKPQRGRKIDPNDPAVVRYKDYLRGRHDQVLQQSGGGRKVYSYGYAFNGFAAELTAAQAQQLAQTRGVVAVTKDELMRRTTSSTPAFLGLTGSEGFWATKAKGEGVVIGIIDSGVWPEHPSFSDRTDTNGNASKDGKLGYQQLPGWHGRCVPGDLFNASHCNQKLIGAQFYNAGFGGNAGVLTELPYEFNSPRDTDGHGTHTASTAGGNANVPATGAAAPFGSISGMAPRARVSVYKVCWGRGDEGGCFSTDSVAAIDQAVADGVDVINFSISGTSTNFRDPVEIAFLFAADAGVFVAASAGNSGPASFTVAHPSPWLTTVAAGTHNRDPRGSVTLGNGSTYVGASIAGPLATKPLINAEDAGLSGADPNAVLLCFTAADNGGTPVLDPAKVAGKIVVCDRGVSARTDKSLAVATAGGVGMILVNTSPNSVNGDLHAVPTVHLQDTDRAAVKAYAAAAGATATINASSIVFNAPAPFTATFSSRGPLRAGNGDLLKPDLMAPGQDILAGVSPAAGGHLFDIISGTSMSSPHVAGLAALMKELKPTWSPMAIKSALMTTAGDVLDGGTPAPETNPVLIFRQGAGHVRPLAATDPGIVFDSSFGDWLGFLCGTQLPTSFCTDAGVPVLDPSNLNVPSIAIGDLAGAQTVVRKVTNVGTNPATYSASVNGLAGLALSITPASLTLAPGETKPFAIAFTRTSAALNAYAGGQLRLSDGVRTARIPIVVRPIPLAAPVQVSGSYTVRFGYDGPFTATPRGLVAATTSPGTVADDPTNGDCSLTSPNARLIPVVIPVGITYARFSLFDADVNPGTDIDLCVFNASKVLVGASATGTSAEEVNLLNPAADTYTVVVQGWGVVGSSPFKLHTWLLGSADAGNMTVTAPAAATTGGTGTVTLGFSGLTAGVKYLGSVAYGGTTGLPNPTIVRVDP
jgi:hypothetical protein